MLAHDNRHASLASCSRDRLAPSVRPRCARRARLLCRADGNVRHAVVIGGGIGGLTAAAKLAKAGLRVTLLEQGEKVGGRCQSQYVETKIGSFRFDTGPSLLLLPRVYDQTFASLGSSMQAVAPSQRVQPAAYRVFIENSAPLDLLYDVPAMITQLEEVEEGAGRAYLEWLAVARAELELGTRHFIERDFNSPLDMVDPGRTLPLLARVNAQELLGQHHSRLAARFKDPRLQALFSFQDLYVGLSPYTAPGIFSLLAATEVTDGVHYPIGGFQQITKGLRDIATSLGVVIRNRSRVVRINTAADTSAYQPPELSSNGAEGEGGGQEGEPDYPVSRSPSPGLLAGLGLGQGGRAGLGGFLGGGTRITGVTLKGGEVLEADLVVSNRDVPLTYELLGHTTYGYQQQRSLTKKSYSAAVIAYNFCVQGVLDKLAHHNVFLSEFYERSWQRATGPDTLLACPNFYIHAPCRTDPTAAPPGCDSIMVLMPVANMQEMLASRSSGRDSSVTISDESGRPEYDSLVEIGRLAIAYTLKQAGVCDDFLSKVVDEFVIDPPEWRQRYGIEHGAAFGMSHSLDQLAAFRPGVKDNKVRGLYMVGASARPGNGVPLVMISADLAVKRVLDDIDKGQV
ncbi:hypothetical protein V8C86DRAFT_2696089 [Haematococcus lacustris]